MFWAQALCQVITLSPIANLANKSSIMFFECMLNARDGDNRCFRETNDLRCIENRENARVLVQVT